MPVWPDILQAILPSTVQASGAEAEADEEEEEEEEVYVPPEMDKVVSHFARPLCSVPKTHTERGAMAISMRSSRSGFSQALPWSYQSPTGSS